MTPCISPTSWELALPHTSSCASSCKVPVCPEQLPVLECFEPACREAEPSPFQRCGHGWRAGQQPRSSHQSAPASLTLSKGDCASAALQKGTQGTEWGCLQGNLLHSHPSLKTFEPRDWQPHPYSVQITGLLLAQALAAPPGPAPGDSFWGGEGEAGWGSTGGCRRVVLYPGAGELRERRVGVLAAVPAAQLPQGLQAGRPAAQALLASSSVHQTETGQWVTEGSTLAPGQRLWVPGWEWWGEGGSV